MIYLCIEANAACHLVLGSRIFLLGQFTSLIELAELLKCKWFCGNILLHLPKAPPDENHADGSHNQDDDKCRHGYRQVT